MHIGVLGVNHKSADLRLRELLAKACHKRFSSGSYVHGDHALVLLSTCNRTEVYFSSEDLAATHSYLLGVLRYDVVEEFEHKLYSYFGYDCFTHLCRVTVGMDSAILAETEIQGQVKNAYEGATLFTKLTRELHFLFQKCLKIGKEVRTSFPSIRGMPNLEDAVIHVSEEHFLKVLDKKVLFVGISDINNKILKSLKTYGFKDISLCNRTNGKAKEIAKQEGIHFIPWHQLSLWHEFDFIIFGTKSPEYLAGRNDLSLTSDTKKLIIDLSVPRNVDPKIGKHTQIHLLNIDQINQQVDKVRRLKKNQVDKIDQLLFELADKQVRAFHYKEKKRESQFQKIQVLGF